MINRDLIIDCFAGGGGASVGIEMALGRSVDIAINHDIQAIRIHKVNHPSTLHLTEDIFKVDLQKYVGGRHVALMWASPDCTSHSKAKGGQPRKKGLRILPWAVYKHAKAILPDVIIMENVEEIQQWGPLDPDGHPIPERKGEDYKKFISAMKTLGYAFDSRELVAADYGAPTTRKRWYAIFRRDGKEIVWPEPTRSKSGIELPQWEQCGDYIDWSDLGKSIFDRKKPLADATMARIANGVKKYIIDNPNPYIVNDKRAIAFLIQYHSETKKGDARGQTLREPIKTIDTNNRYGLVTAFITKFYKTGIGQGCDEPIHTITTSPGHFGLEAKGLSQKTGETAQIEVNMIEITKDFLKSTVIGQEGTSEDERFDVIESKEHIEEDDYLENLAFVGFKTNGSPIIVLFEYAICTDGLESEHKNKEAAVVPATYKCVANLVEGGTTNKLPYHIYVPKTSATQITQTA